ncbi:MAG: bifunctional DNA primase/polymerase [Rhodospirillales bacterium]|nr:MAG: bifunctional DNA primase/polymerase [Rhodospirillales bacterium]
MHNFYNVAATYLDFCWLPIPLQPKDKKPFDGYKWKDARLTSETARNFPKDCNIGVALGENSNGLVDLDFDSSEAGIIANKLFPHLPGFGRKSAPFGHKILYCPDAGKTQQFKLTSEQAEIAGFTEKAVVMELRGNGGYTMFPPSVHPSGETVQWHNSKLPEDIPVMKWDELQKSCGLCASLAVFLKKYPTAQGARDEICLALAGALLRAGLPLDQVDGWIVFIAEQKGDNEAHMRKKAEATKEKMDAGEEVTGLPKLCELLGIEKLKDVLSKWLYGSASSVTAKAEKEIAELNERFLVIENDGGKCRVAFLFQQPLDKDQIRLVLVLQSFEDFKNAL